MVDLGVAVARVAGQDRAGGGAGFIRPRKTHQQGGVQQLACDMQQLYQENSGASLKLRGYRRRASIGTDGEHHPTTSRIGDVAGDGWVEMRSLLGDLPLPGLVVRMLLF